MEGDKVENYFIKIDGKKKYKCEICDYITERKSNIESHINGKGHRTKYETKSNYETSKSIPIPDITKRKFKNCEDILKQIVEEKNVLFNIFKKKIKYSHKNGVCERLLQVIEEEIIIRKALLIFEEYDDPFEYC